MHTLCAALQHDTPSHTLLCCAVLCCHQVPSSQAVSVPSAARPPMEPLTAHNTQQQQQQQSPQQPPSPPPQQQQQQEEDGTSLLPASSTLKSTDQQQLFRMSPAGLDTVTFLLAAGPSEPLRPLADVASGGEAARVMLALKAAAAAVAAGSSAAGSNAAAAGSNAAGGGGGGPPPVLVLDELDAGVGSRLGAPVGRLLQRLVVGAQPTASQVLVVTHTPQVSRGHRGGGGGRGGGGWGFRKPEKGDREWCPSARRWWSHTLHR